MATTVKTCKKCEKGYYIRAADAAFYDKINVLYPDLCPNCREQRRMAFRNERTLHLRNCSKCKKEIVSIYAHDVDFPVYCSNCWTSEDWEAKEYAKDFDFSKSFFEQYNDLKNSVPRINLFNTDCKESEYTNQSYNNENCYLCFGIKDCQHCFFSSNILRCDNVFDSEYIFDSKDCYECVDCFDLKNCFYSKKSRDCKNCDLLYDCNDCEDCIACVGLRGKKFHIFNKPCSEEAYKKFRAEYLSKGGDYFHELFDKFLKFTLDYPRKSFWMHRSEGVLGNNIYNSRDAYHVFEAFETKDCAYSSWIFRANDCLDVYGVSTSSYCYESIGVDESNKALFSNNCECCSDIYYSDLCLFSKKLFGCIGLKNKKYYIFNKKYLKDDYEKLVKKIIEHMKKTGEWGEFFPIENSPFAYNVTIANDFYHLSEKEIKEKKYNYRNLIPLHQGEETIKSCELPDSIEDVNESILDEILSCCDCGRNYQILKEEFTFYKEKHVHLPEKCPDCRHQDRVKLRSPHRLWERACGHCGKIMLCTYPPEKPDIVFCRGCYKKEITGKQNGPPEIIHKH